MNGTKGRGIPSASQQVQHTRFPSWGEKGDEGFFSPGLPWVREEADEGVLEPEAPLRVEADEGVVVW